MAPHDPTPVSDASTPGGVRPWSALAAVAAGGLVGSAARAGLGLLIRGPDGGFPTAILVANLAGSFLLGLYLARRERAVSGPNAMRFWAIGLLGSFTTFSTFSVDLLGLLQAGRPLASAGYLAASLVGGLGLALAGQRIGAVIR